MSSPTVTCSFTMDRSVYNAYKSVVSSHGENVKGNLIRYMMQVIEYQTPNAETIEAIREADQMMTDPNTRTYSSFAEILSEIVDE